MPNLAAAKGFSLLEALVAAALLAGAIGSVAHLLTRAASQTFAAERVAVALMAAQSKLEQLRAERFAFDAAGARVESPALTPSAADALARDAPPHVEALDRFGALVGRDVVPIYLRRWSVAAGPFEADTLVLAVCVSSASGPAPAAPVCVWSLRSRQP